MTYSVADTGRGAPPLRAVGALRSVLPVTTEMSVLSDRDGIREVEVAGRRIHVGWAGEGWTADVRPFTESDSRVDVVAARRLSPGAIAALNGAGVGWVDELGNAEISIGNTGGLPHRPSEPLTPSRPPRWTPAFVSVAEAVLCGTDATVSATAAATGLSTGTCTNALRTLTDLGLLEADARRGRGAGRRIVDRDALLCRVCRRGDGLRVSGPGCRWGHLARPDPRPDRPRAAIAVPRHPVGCDRSGRRGGHGAAAHQRRRRCRLRRRLPTVSALEMVARSLDLKPIEGGRLILRPMPIGWTTESRTLSAGLFVAPWPRVYVDLRGLGVRGEEASEHLAEVCRDR
ncbi:MAG: hypothetical protein V9F03_08390 [Microthrixaceae bacterium]